jgi:hypothetical protein
MTWVEHVAYIGEKRNACRISVGNPEGETRLGRAICRWEYNIKTNFREIGCCGIDWIHLAQERNQWTILVNMVLNLQVS